MKLLPSLLASSILLFGAELGAQPVIVQPLGSATIGADGTGSCPGNVVEDRCRRATVTAAGVEAIPIDLKIQLPASTSIGTVVFLNGGGSTQPIEVHGAPAESMITTLAQTHHFTVIQASCGIPTGATQTGCNVSMAGTGMKKAAGGRVATLLEAIDQDAELHRPGTPICVVGQSGGGIWAAFAVLHYGMGRIVDLVITTGGPAFTRTDWHCEGRTNLEWSAILDARQLSGTGGGAAGIPDIVDNAFGWNGARGDCAHQSNRGAVPWRADSVISAGADYRLPSTKWIFLFGTSDTITIVVPMARVLEDLIAGHNGGASCASGNNATCLEQTVSGTTHFVPASTNGANQIVADLVAECVSR